MEVEILSRPDEPPLGAGEAAHGPTAAAIANAVHDALGVRVRDLPITRDRIIAAAMEVADALLEDPERRRRAGARDCARARSSRPRPGFDLEGEFGAVGAMRARLEAGEQADILILTSALIRELGEGGSFATIRLAISGRSRPRSPSGPGIRRRRARRRGRPRRGPESGRRHLLPGSRAGDGRHPLREGPEKPGALGGAVGAAAAVRQTARRPCASSRRPTPGDRSAARRRPRSSSRPA